MAHYLNVQVSGQLQAFGSAAVVLYGVKLLGTSGSAHDMQDLETSEEVVSIPFQ